MPILPLHRIVVLVPNVSEACVYFLKPYLPGEYRKRFSSILFNFSAGITLISNFLAPRVEFALYALKSYACLAISYDFIPLCKYTFCLLECLLP